MKYSFAILSVFFVLMVILISIAAIAAPAFGSDRNSSISGDQSPTPRVAVTTERVKVTQVRVTMAPRETPRIRSGEVEVPITVRVIPTPVIPQTTVTIPQQPGR